MIFIVLGTQKFQLNRLLEKIDKMIEAGEIKEEVFAQIGQSSYQPRHYKYKEFLDRDLFEEYINSCSLVITHSGVGSIITAIHFQKPVIVFPRLKKYKEHVDDHQLEIAQAFEKKRFVLCCYEQDNLSKIIEKSKTFQFEKYQSSTKRIIEIIKEFLNENV